MTAEMMDSMPMMMQGMDMKMMQDCIEACSAAEQACTMCADSDTAEGMGRCASMCTMTADVAATLMRMMLRPMGFDMPSMMAMLEACMTMCRACADECMMHADMSETCKMCAQVCTNCADACSAMMASMKPVTA
jgi:hypothetical protein